LLGVHGLAPPLSVPTPGCLAQRRAGTCHPQTGQAADDRPDSYQKTDWRARRIGVLVHGSQTGTVWQQRLAAFRQGSQGSAGRRVIGASAALDGKISLSRAIVQITGRGVSCYADGLKHAARQSETLHSLLIRHEQVVYAQAQQTAACNVTHTIEERLARWLLRARDLSQSDTLPFTQEFLAEMLGVRRTSVSVVAHTPGMRESACECYFAVSKYYDTLLGILPNR
jgi:Crp-like helix-turn-helix domain